MRNHLVKAALAEGCNAVRARVFGAVTTRAVKSDEKKGLGLTTRERERYEYWGGGGGGGGGGGVGGWGCLRILVWFFGFVVVCGSSPHSPLP